jgi:uncharacterized membrane protein
MANLIVLTFDNTDEAESVLQALKRLERDGHLDLDDTATIVKDADGKVHIHNRASDATKFGAVAGGLLAPLVFFMFPIAGIAAGVAGGALIGRALDRGVDGTFVKEVSQSLEPGHSALFLLVGEANINAAFAALRSHKGKVYHTTLSSEVEESLRSTLGEQPNYLTNG